MDIKLLKAKMVLRDMTADTVCEYLEISRSTWFRKLSGKTEFTRREISLIASALSLDKGEIIEIFFFFFLSFAQQKEM